MTTEDDWTEPTFHVAAVVLESSSDVPDYKPLYEERFLFIKAGSIQEAKEKAIHYASTPLSYKNQYGETITWSLKEFVEVKSMDKDEIIDGTELFARFFRNYEAYRQAFLNQSEEE